MKKIDFLKMKLMKKYIKIIVILIVFAFLMISCGGTKEVVNVTYSDVEEQVTLLPIQEEYGRLLNVKPEEITNIPLYEFIDDWMNTPYKLGGETKKGIDCSSFTQLLYIEVFKKYIERTAQKQFDSEHISKFRGKEFLQEGDFIFFKTPNTTNREITHVGIYLKGNKFINATSYKGSNGAGGVKLDDLTNPFWEKRFVAGGVRTDLKKE